MPLPDALLRSLGNGLLQQRAGLELDPITCGDVDGFASAGVAAGTGGALHARSGKNTGQAQTFTGFEGLNENFLESVDSSLVRLVF